MTALRCSRHPEVRALYHCDGCGRRLCDDCIEVGHRLLFCTWCRERALPLDAADAATAPDLERQTARRRPYSARDVLLYPLRGQGGFVLWGTVLYLLVLRIVAAIGSISGVGGIFAGILVLVLGTVLLALVPGLSFAIVRTTAAGADEMPDWPDWADFGERSSEIFAALVLGLMALVPAVLLAWVAGCEPRDLAASPFCLLIGTVGLVLGLPAWVVGVGAVGVWGDPWLGVRWDLHLRALASVWRPALAISAGLVGLSTAGWLVGRLFAWMPLLGSLITLVVDVYTWFLAMHLVGLLMRRHEPTVEPVYLRK